MPPIQAGIDVPCMGPGTGNGTPNQGLGQQPFDVFPVALVEGHKRASGVKSPGDYPEANLNVDLFSSGEAKRTAGVNNPDQPDSATTWPLARSMMSV